MSKSFSFCAVCFFCSLACNVFAQSAAYNYCIKDAAKVSDEAMAECMKAENSRLNKQIYSEYEKISKDSSFTNWNQGSGMFRSSLPRSRQPVFIGDLGRKLLLVTVSRGIQAVEQFV